MERFKAWFLLHKLWILIGASLVVVLVVTGVIVADARDDARQRENQRIADEARRQEQELMKQLEASPSPSPSVASTPSLQPTPTPSTKPKSSPTSVATTQATSSPTSAVSSSSTATVSWSHNGSDWQSSGTPPSCPSPLTLTTPVEVSLITSMLYPGQTRGTDYKPHGGFRFDNSANDAVSVKAPMSATLVQGSRYLESGEMQYLFDFINSCGIMYRFDHLKNLSSKMAEAANQLPEAKADDTRTTFFSSTIAVSAGETIATAVGVTGNTFVDLGVYDLRQKNTAAQDAGYVSAHQDEGSQAYYAVCWLDWFSSGDSATVKSLSGTGTADKTSDYCK